MISFARRRSRNMLASAAAFALLAAFTWVYGASLRDPMFLTGWVLLTGCLALALLNGRKKLSVLPLGTAAAWVQFHIYTGWAVVGVFLLHGGLVPPQGVLELALWCVFILVAASGILGAFLSREVPRRMARIVEPVLFERIQGFRRRLAEEAHQLALASIIEMKSATIAQFYADRLQPFLSAPRNLLGHLVQHSSQMLKLLRELDGLERYLDADSKACVERLKDIVKAKDSLDKQYAHLGLMKLWLFVHIPLTYSLLLMAAAHVVSVYAYSAGAP